MYPILDEETTFFVHGGPSYTTWQWQLFQHYSELLLEAKDSPELMLQYKMADNSIPVRFPNVKGLKCHPHSCAKVTGDSGEKLQPVLNTMAMYQSSTISCYFYVAWKVLLAMSQCFPLNSIFSIWMLPFVARVSLDPSAIINFTLHASWYYGTVHVLCLLIDHQLCSGFKCKAVPGRGGGGGRPASALFSSDDLLDTTSRLPLPFPKFALIGP